MRTRRGSTEGRTAKPEKNKRWTERFQKAPTPLVLWRLEWHRNSQSQAEQTDRRTPAGPRSGQIQNSDGIQEGGGMVPADTVTAAPRLGEREARQDALVLDDLAEHFHRSLA